MTPQQEAPITPGTGSAVARFLRQFTVLFGAMRELWVVLAVKLLAIVAYSIMNTTFVLWLSADLGFGDASAGYWVAAWSAMMTLITVLVGSLTDAIGLRRAFLLGVYICLVARAVLTLTTWKWLALAGGMLPLAIGEALGTPVMVAAIRRYSTTAQRSMAFSMFYAMMNVGFLIAAKIFDETRAYMGEHGRTVIPFLGLELTTYRVLFLISLIFELILVPILYFGLREGAEATDEGVRIVPRKPRETSPFCATCGYDLTANISGVCPECGSQAGAPRAAPSGIWAAMMRGMRDTIRETARIFVGLWRQPGFYRFLAFLTLAAFVRLIFVQMHYTYPKFGIRELGEGAPIGMLWAINSILIIVLVPIVGALSQRVSAYQMVTWGSAIAAASVFILTLPPAWFRGAADSPLLTWIWSWYLGLSGSVNPWYAMILIYVIVLSVGEAVYSPRLYEYAAVIAPKGQEGSYMALSYLPFFMAKLLVASFSGVLLARYCPEIGPRDSSTMWLIIALTTTIAPVGLIALRRVIRAPEAGREDPAAG